MVRSAMVERARACLRSCEAFDAEGATEHFAEDALLWNAPIPPIRGKSEIKNVLRRLFATCTSYEATIHHQACNGSVVFLERTDTIDVRGVRVSAPVAAVICFENERIVSWREYFDLLHLVRQLTLQSGRKLVELISRRTSPLGSN